MGYTSRYLLAAPQKRDMDGHGDDESLYPNRGNSGGPSFDRRLLLAGSAVAGASALAGCSSGGQGTDAETTTDQETTTNETITADSTVFVFNTGDRTVSVIDVETDSVVATPSLGLTASFPSNQYAPSLTDTADDPLWLNVGRGVRAVAVGSLAEVASIETGSGANWQELTPDGDYVVVSAREPAHTQYRIDADPTADSFGTVTAELDRTDEGGRNDNDGPGPCDITVHPDGEYAYVPDLYGDTLTVLDIESFEIETQVEVEPVTDASAAAPWMGTCSPDGSTLLVEHNEGSNGTESIWDLTDPANPQLSGRLTNDDGLGQRPLTSEIDADSETGYVFTPGSNAVSVVDLDSATVTEQIDVGGSAFVGTWDTAHEKLYVPVRSSDEVVVIEAASGEIVTRISTGPSPYGATAATVRPVDDRLTGTPSASQRLGQALSGDGTTYCIGECACGHEL
jgi:YVTN family beta-propeller protein